MDRDATLRQTVLAASAHQVSVKVNVVTYSAKHLALNIVVPNCNDDVQNADETDVDCGGSCAPVKRCSELFKCIDPSDCKTSICVSNICQGQCSY